MQVGDVDQERADRFCRQAGVIVQHMAFLGEGAMWRTVVGLGIIATISNGFVLLDVSPYYQSIIKGAIIVAALALDGGLTRLVRAK